MVGEVVANIFKGLVSSGLPILGVVLVAVWVGKLVHDLLTRYKIDEELTSKNNAAVGVALAGYYVGLAIAISGVVMGPSREVLFNIRSDFQSDLDNKTVSENLRKELKNNGISLSQNATVSIKEKAEGKQWRLKDKGKTYMITKSAYGLDFYQVTSLVSAIRIVSMYAIIAIVLLNISALINDKLILYRFSNQKELVDDQNSGTGATMAGSYLATGLIVNAAVSGEAANGWLSGLLACLVFFALGQVVLVLAGLWYQLITKYDVHKVIGEDNNIAAGVGFGGFLFAMGYVLRAAMTGASVSWGVDLVSFALYVVVAIVLLTIGRLITDKVFLPKAKISDEIGSQGNIAAASVAAAIYVAIAVLIVSAV
jgi:uncharacterized membrane protein YjfL (UPF0719 family)